MRATFWTTFLTDHEATQALRAGVRWPAQARARRAPRGHHLLRQGGSWTDVEKARKEIEDLRGAVAGLLDAVADNGGLATLGDKALTRARNKLRELEQDTRFKPEERNFLIEQWRKLRDDTERANQELGSARARFAELLRTLQANEDFIEELVQIRQAQKVIDVIHQLTRDIRGASDQLQHLIRGIKPPGA